MTYYVTMNDIQLSEQLNKGGKIHKRRFECADLDEVEIVYQNAMHIGLYNRLTIHSDKLEFDEKRYDVFDHSRITLPNWYIKDHFKQPPKKKGRRSVKTA